MEKTNRGCDKTGSPAYTRYDNEVRVTRITREGLGACELPPVEYVTTERGRGSTRSPTGPLDIDTLGGVSPLGPQVLPPP